MSDVFTVIFMYKLIKRNINVFFKYSIRIKTQFNLL